MPTDKTSSCATEISTSSCNNQQLLNPITNKSQQHKTTSQSDTSFATCDWFSNPKAGQPNDWMLHKPKAGTKLCIKTLRSNLCKRRRTDPTAVANPSTGFLSANQNDDAQPTWYQSQIQNGVAATNPNGAVSNLSKHYRFAPNKQNKAVAGC
ncbi:hypothetical protein F511_16316 [Dorcoceras hygrometricum]|uniref:Uncharacterized protein n=1 Tax=Dorcoceras hygrometricum TaxID=472368 RepID=A0A2Z7B8X9_9LAMI|nr:hypothetical protein F511_16316 [Dorcoceras hygrometricum]